MELLTTLLSLRNRRWLGYVAGVSAAVLALLVRLVLGNALTGHLFITYFPAVWLAALVGGGGPAAVAALLSLVFAYSYSASMTDVGILPEITSDWIGIAFFLAVCSIIVGLIDLLAGALRSLQTTRDALNLSNATLEARVEQRTRELEESNLSLKVEAAAREAAESQARQAQKMQAVGNLTGGIAHDFNNMLSVVIGNIELARNRLARGRTDLTELLDHALGGANRGAALTQRLLAFSRQIPLSPVITDVNALLQGMEELVRRTLGGQVELHFVQGGGLWRTLIDPGQLENAILNLMVNARDAMWKGGRLTVQTQNAQIDEDYASQHAGVVSGHYVVLAVTDTGTGMPPDVIERAFEPFFTTKEVGSGTGLGLSQVYGFVKQSGGQVKICSEVGRGTTVRIYLPRTTEHISSHPHAAPAALPRTVPRGSPEELVLVVEDEEIVARTITATLQELGYSVAHAASGEEALSLLEQIGPISLLLTDVVMPGMTGRKLGDGAIKKLPDLRILYMTGDTAVSIMQNGQTDAGIEVLNKPFTIDQLARKVRKTMTA